MDGEGGGFMRKYWNGSDGTPQDAALERGAAAGDQFEGPIGFTTRCSPVSGWEIARLGHGTLP